VTVARAAAQARKAPPREAAALPGLSIVLPCRDEASNVAHAITAATRAAGTTSRAWEVIVVDDGSTDETAAIAAQHAAIEPRVRLVAHPCNRGYGAALRTGLRAASMPWILLTDADLQFDLGELAAFVGIADEADLVVGRRAPRCDPLGRRINGRLWNLLVRRLFQLPVHDVDCAFKLLRAELVADTPFASDGAMLSTELLVRARAAGARVRELEVRHLPRRDGRQSGADLPVVARAVRELARLTPELRALSRGARARGRA
jgi:glycosyltransferase involved in cell wall biosynthesis